MKSHGRARETACTVQSVQQCSMQSQMSVEVLECVNSHGWRWNTDDEAEGCRIRSEDIDHAIRDRVHKLHGICGDASPWPAEQSFTTTRGSIIARHETKRRPNMKRVTKKSKWRRRAFLTSFSLMEFPWRHSQMANRCRLPRNSGGGQWRRLRFAGCFVQEIIPVCEKVSRRKYGRRELGIGSKWRMSVSHCPPLGAHAHFAVRGTGVAAQVRVGRG